MGEHGPEIVTAATQYHFVNLKTWDKQQTSDHIPQIERQSQATYPEHN